MQNTTFLPFVLFLVMVAMFLERIKQQENSLTIKLNSKGVRVHVIYMPSIDLNDYA